MGQAGSAAHPSTAAGAYSGINTRGIHLAAGDERWTDVVGDPNVEWADTPWAGANGLCQPPDELRANPLSMAENRGCLCEAFRPYPIIWARICFCAAGRLMKKPMKP